jgi:peptidyl-prolyl cis-trans isomerase D
MLTQIRHIQKGTLIVVTVIIVVSFAFLYSDFDFVRGAVGRQDCVVKVYNRCYRQKEAQKLASHFDVALELGMYDFAMVLFGENRQDRDPTDFMMSLVILRKEAENLGIQPTATEIKEAIPQLPLFQQPWVDAAYVQNNILGPNGFTDGDLAGLVKDYLSFQKLRSLIGAGLEAVPAETARLYTKSNQRYTASVVRFDRSEYSKELKLTDEEIKTYFEENKEDLNSESKRGFDFVKFIPKPEVEGATNEQKAKANLDFANAVNRAYADLANDGAEFTKVAAQYVGDKAEFKLEQGKLEPFSPAEPPAMLKEDKTTMEALFSGAQQVDAVTVPLQVEGGGYYVFHYSTLVEPVPLTLEQATPAIREALTATKSNRAVSDAASAALAKLNEAVKGGKSFDEAATGLGLKPEALPNFSESEPPADLEDAGLIVGAVSGLVAKEISSVTERPGGQGSLLVYVDKIEIYKDAEADSRKKELAATVESQLDRTLFTSWFNQRRAESGSERPDAPTNL